MMHAKQAASAIRISILDSIFICDYFKST